MTARLSSKQHYIVSRTGHESENKYLHPIVKMATFYKLSKTQPARETFLSLRLIHTKKKTVRHNL